MRARNITFPSDLLWGTISIYKDDALLIEGVDYARTNNGTHYSFHITYIHTAHTLRIVGTEAIPEFPLLIILPLFMIATLLAVIVYRRKHSKQR